jgi:hypothetical protein
VADDDDVGAVAVEAQVVLPPLPQFGGALAVFELEELLDDSNDEPNDVASDDGGDVD